MHATHPAREHKRIASILKGFWVYDTSQMQAKTYMVESNEIIIKFTEEEPVRHVLSVDQRALQACQKLGFQKVDTHAEDIKPNEKFLKGMINKSGDCTKTGYDTSHMEAKTYAMLPDPVNPEPNRFVMIVNTPPPKGGGF